MPVRVQSNASLLLSKGQHRTVFRNPRGLKKYYSFYYDSSGLDLVYDVSDDGTLWSLIGNWRVTQDDPECFDVKFIEDGGNQQLVVWVAWHNGTSTKYIRGTIADAASTISWDAEQIIDAAINDEALGEPHCISLARVDNGYLVVHFTEDYTNMGKDYRLVKVIGSDGDGAAPNWLNEQTQADPSANSNNQDKAEIWFATEAFGPDFPERYCALTRFQDEIDIVSYEMGEWLEEWDGASWNIIYGGNFGLREPTTGAVLSLLIDDNDCVVYLYENGSDDLAARIGGQPGERPATGITVVSWTVPHDACCLSFDGNPPVSAPSTDEVSGSWSPSAGGDLYAMVDDGYTDDDSTYIENTADDACRLGGLTEVDHKYTSVCVRAALTGADGAGIKIETYKGGVWVQTLIVNRPLSTTIENVAMRVGLNLGDFDEIQITSTLGASDSIRIYNVFVDHRKVIMSYHSSNRTLDWGMRTMSPKSVASNTFTPVQLISYHQPITALSCWSRVIENSLHIAGQHGSTVIYNEHPAYKALSTTLADLEFPDQNYYLGPHST